MMEQEIITEPVASKGGKCSNNQTDLNAFKTSTPALYSEKIFTQTPQNKTFKYKEDAIKYIQDKSLYLFSEDLSQVNRSKRYYTVDRSTIWQASTTKKYHLYENYEATDKIKLFIDLNIKQKDISQNVDRLELFKNTIHTVIGLMNKAIVQYNIKDPEIIILSSCREEKLSARIIFNNVVFSSFASMKFFMMAIDSPLTRNNTIDMNAYTVECARLLWNSKLGKSDNLEFFRSINYQHQTDEQLFMDCLLTNVLNNVAVISCEVPQNVKIVRKEIPKQVTAAVPIVGYDKRVGKIAITVLKKYVDILDFRRGNNYNDWLTIGMCLHNCNPSNACFNLWDEFSKKSSFYDGRDICAYKWNSFKFGGLGFGSLKFYAKSDNSDKFAKIDTSHDEPTYESIKFDQSYLLDIKNNETIKSLKTVGTHAYKWLTDISVKVLAIKSPYDTGKTTLIKQILKEFNPKKVLFVSYRQSLTHDLHSVFKKFDVDSYLDGYFYGSRIICQIESLKKLILCAHFEYIVELPSYDIVILDEIESILAHFRSSTLKDKEETFRLLNDIIFNSEKVLALDGDFHNRAHEFIKDIGNSIILENLHKKNIRHFIFTNNKNIFNSKIDDDLANGKNIAIISMSSTSANAYYDTYNKMYKSTLHCAKSDDVLKKELKDVANYWTQFQLVCYSPSIEAGVNFDVEHFDKIYVVLSIMSTTPRALMQMCSRIRKLKDRNVNVFLNGMPFRVKANCWKFDEIKEYVLDMFKKYLTPETVINKETGKKVLRYNYDLYTKILIHNETENENKNPAYFVPCLIKLLTEKGHTYEYSDEKTDGKAIKTVTQNNMKNELLNARDINDMEFAELISRQKSNVATREEKVMIEKFCYKKNWKIDVVDETFVMKYYGLTYVLFNLRYLLDDTKIEPYLTVDNNTDEQVVSFDKVRMLERVKIIKDIITKLGFTSVKDKTVLTKEVFQIGVKKVRDESELFTNPVKTIPLFGMSKSKSNMCTILSFMSFINSLFKNWGFRVHTHKMCKCVKDDERKGKRKIISVYGYKILFINEIINYV